MRKYGGYNVDLFGYNISGLDTTDSRLHRAARRAAGSVPCTIPYCSNYNLRCTIASRTNSLAALCFDSIEVGNTLVTDISSFILGRFRGIILCLVLDCGVLFLSERPAFGNLCAEVEWNYCRS